MDHLTFMSTSDSTHLPTNSSEPFSTASPVVKRGRMGVGSNVARFLPVLPWALDEKGISYVWKVLDRSFIEGVGASLHALFRQIGTAESETASHLLAIRKMEQQELEKSRLSTLRMVAEEKRIATRAGYLSLLPKKPIHVLADQSSRWELKLEMDLGKGYRHVYKESTNVKSIFGNRGGPIPVTLCRNLTRESVKTLYSPDLMYLYTYKSDGLRHLLVLCRTTVHEQPIAMLVDRSGSGVFILPNVDAPAELYNGTVLDGELVTGGSFLVFDCLSVSGTLCGHLNKVHRNQLGCNVLECLSGKDLPMASPSPSPNPSTSTKVSESGSNIKSGPGSANHWSPYVTQMRLGNGLRIAYKREWAAWDMAEVLKRVPPLLDHAMDGWIATAAETPVKSGLDKTQFKIKAEHTIDFVTKKLSLGEGARARLLAFDRSVHQLVVVRQEWVVELPEAWCEREHWVDGAIVECGYDGQLKQWHVIKVRHDKTRPNELQTVLSTFEESIMDPISAEELFPACITPPIATPRTLLTSWTPKPMCVLRTQWKTSLVDERFGK